MPKLNVVFDLGSHSIKIAVAKKQDMDLYEMRLPEHIIEEGQIRMPNALSDFLKQVKKECKLPSGPCGLVLPGNKAICKCVTLPPMTEQQLMLNLPYEFQDFVRGNLNQYHFDYALCEDVVAEGEEKKEMVLMAAAAEKKFIQEMHRIFARAGFSIVAMLPEEMALIELVRADRKKKKAGCDQYCFVEFGHQSTKIFIIGDDRVQVYRQFDLGGMHLDTVVADALNVDTFVADFYKRKNHENIMGSDPAMEVYNRVAVECLKVVNFYHFTNRENSLDGIYLIGGGSGIEAFQSVLRETVDLPILSMSELVSRSAEDGVLPNVCASAAGMLLGGE